MTCHRPTIDLNECSDSNSANFASIESLFQSTAPLYLKDFFKNSRFGLGSVRSVAVFRW